MTNQQTQEGDLRQNRPEGVVAEFKVDTGSFPAELGWAMGGFTTIVTKSGSCEPTASSTLTVTEGKISGGGANVSGSIGHEGLVRVSINGAYANGQLSGNAGSGKWNGASGGIPCSGRWQASRQ